MLDFVPISSLRTEKGALAALIETLGEDAAMPVELPDPLQATTNFRIVSDALSVSGAATLGVGSIFKGALSAGEQGFFFDAMAFTDRYTERPLPDQSILGTRWGVGLRVLLRVSDIKANIALNFGLVGAAVEMQQARARYEIVGIGIGIDGLIAVLEELPSIGDFKYETYTKLNGAVVKKLAKYLADHRDSLEPEPVAVALAKPLDPLAAARSIYYAMVSIADGRSYQDAIARADLTLDREAIRNVYVQLLQSDDPTKRPDRGAETAAERWLRH